MNLGRMRKLKEKLKTEMKIHMSPLKIQRERLKTLQ